MLNLRWISLLSQEPVLFSSPIRENLDHLTIIMTLESRVLLNTPMWSPLSTGKDKVWTSVWTTWQHYEAETHMRRSICIAVQLRHGYPNEHPIARSSDVWRVFCEFRVRSVPYSCYSKITCSVLRQTVLYGGSVVCPFDKVICYLWFGWLWL